MSKFLIALSLLCVSLAFLQVGRWRTFLYGTLFILIGFGIIDNFLNHTIKRSVRNWLLFFVAYFFLMSISIYINSSGSVHRSIIMQLSGVILFFYLITKKPSRIEPIISLLILFGTVQVLFGLLQLFNTSLFDSVFDCVLKGERSLSNYHFKVGRLTSYWQDAPRFGTILAAAFPFALYTAIRRRSKLCLGFAFVFPLVSIFTVTRTTVLSVILSFVLILGKSKWLRIRNIIIAVVLFAIAFQFGEMLIPGRTGRHLLESFADYRGEFGPHAVWYNRIRIYLDMVPITFASPVIGSGALYQNYLEYGYLSVHNSLLQSVLVYGYPATILLLILIGKLVSIVVQGLNNDARMLEVCLALSALSIFLAGLPHGVLFDAPINLLFWLTSGLALHSSFHKNKDKNALVAL